MRSFGNLDDLVWFYPRQGARESVIVLEVERVLVPCPRCSTWPMSANFSARGKWKDQVAKIKFRCPKCDHQETMPVSAKAARRSEDA
jgi:hypothetical protein